MMHDLSPSYWNNRYHTNDFSWDLGVVSSPLKAYFDQLKNRALKILIPGAGNAYEAEYLHLQGFKNVFVLDFASEPLLHIKERIPSFNSEHLIHNDFFEHSGQYDLIIEQTFFCAIHPSLRKRYVLHMLQLLKPGGKLAGVLFDDRLHTDKPPFGGSMDEYNPLFFPDFQKLYFDPCCNSIKPRAGRELFILLQKKAL